MWTQAQLEKTVLMPNVKFGRTWSQVSRSSGVDG
jgi:hypothetical protein